MIDKLCVNDPHQRKQAYDRILNYIGQAKLPKRSQPRTYPRAVWCIGKGYPRRRIQNMDAQSKWH